MPCLLGVVTAESYNKRGSLTNQTGRFETIVRESFDQAESKTEIFYDSAKEIISTNSSPDVGFSKSVNPYRGCEHGCSYCYARPTHEYLGLSAGTDFETKIFVKKDAAELLRKALMKKSYSPEIIAMSGVTDPYQPIERDLQITRQCLSVLQEFRNPTVLISKSALMTRDIDILSEMAKDDLVRVMLTITTLDEDIRRRLEPRAATADLRLNALRKLREAGIPAGILIAPVIPGLTDHEIPGILMAAAEAGAQTAGYVLLRLPYGVKEIFIDWLERNFPNRKNKVLDRIRNLRDGALNDSTFGKRGRGIGVFSTEIKSLFRAGLKKSGIANVRTELRTDLFKRPDTTSQMQLF